MVLVTLLLPSGGSSERNQSITMPHHLHLLFAAFVFSACIGALEEHFPSPHGKLPQILRSCQLLKFPVRFPRRYSGGNTTSVLVAPASSIITESLSSPTSLSTRSLRGSSANLFPTVSIKVGPPRSSNEDPVLGGSSTVIDETASVQAEASTPGRTSLPALISSSTRSAHNEPTSTNTSHHGVKPNHTSITYWGTEGPSACSSFLSTCSDQLYIPVTSTIFWTNETTTITAGDPSPLPVLIQPLPLCGNVTSRRCPTSHCRHCAGPLTPDPFRVSTDAFAMLVTVLVTKKLPAVVTVSAPPVSFSFGPQAQPTVTPSPASKPTSIPTPVPFPDRTGLEKVPTSEVDTRVTTPFMTGDIPVPTNPTVGLPPVGKSEPGDSSVEAPAHLADMALAIDPVPALVEPVIHVNSAVTAPSEIAAAIAPSEVVADSHTFVAGTPHATLTINGQAITVEPSQIIAHGTTIALPVPSTASGSPISSPTLSAVTVGAITFSLGPTAAIIGSSTYLFSPGEPPLTTVVDGQPIRIGANGIGFASTTVPIPIAQTSPTLLPVVADGLEIDVGSNKAIINGVTYAIGSGATPQTVVIGTKTLTFGSGGVNLPDTTIPPYYPPTVPSPVVVDGLTFSIDATQAVISGTTYAIGPGAVPKTVVFGTETISLGPGGVGLPATTIPPYYPPTVPSPVVVDGLTFYIDATQAIISGTTYAIGPGAAPRTVVFGTETISLGPGGVGLPMTTLVPPSLPSVAPIPMTADGLTFSIEPTDVIIGGSTYAIGSGAPTETLIISGETVKIGPGGVALPTTTIAPPGASSTGLISFTGAASTFGPVLSLIGGCLVCFSLGVIIL